MTDNEQKPTKNNIEDFLETIAENFEKQDREMYGHLYREHFTEDKYPEGQPPSAEDFELFFTDFDREQNAVISIILSQLNIPKDNAWRVRYIYNNYRAFENFLSGLTRKTEGSVCSVDRSRWLLQNYVSKQINGEYEKLDKEVWYAPLPSTVDAWFHLMDVYPGFQNAHNIVDLPQAIIKLFSVYGEVNSTQEDK